MALMQTASRHLDWVLIDPKNGQLPQVGDLVSADAGGMPVYRVMALEDRTARLRDDVHGADWVMPLAAFRWKAAS
jgi:hypothetical protein